MVVVSLIKIWTAHASRMRLKGDRERRKDVKFKKER